MPNKTCPYCKVEFYARKERIYCSRGCSEMTARKYPDFKCKYCDKTFRKAHSYHKGMYCSKECSAKGRRKFGGKQVLVKCADCQKEIVKKVSELRDSKTGKPKTRFFCSMNCMSLWLRGRFTKELHHNYLGGKRTDEYRGQKWRTLTRQSILEKFECTCQSCLVSYWENTSHLDVHHIIPYRDCKNPIEANEMSNLTLLCKKCHTRETGKEISIRKRKEVLANECQRH